MFKDHFYNFKVLIISIIGVVIYWSGGVTVGGSNKVMLCQILVSLFITLSITLQLIFSLLTLKLLLFSPCIQFVMRFETVDFALYTV